MRRCEKTVRSVSYDACSWPSACPEGAPSRERGNIPPNITGAPDGTPAFRFLPDADARRVLSYLEWFGISYKTVASSLEAAELRASVRSREELLADMGSELQAQGGVLAKV